ncbi:hypothetical protein QJQ45_014434, partial [Haematococcus lacustris]
ATDIAMVRKKQAAPGRSGGLQPTCKSRKRTRLPPSKDPPADSVVVLHVAKTDCAPPGAIAQLVFATSSELAMPAALAAHAVAGDEPGLTFTPVDGPGGSSPLAAPVGLAAPAAALHLHHHLQRILLNY